MALVSDPISAGIGLVDTVIQRFFPDKTQEEQAKLAATLSVISGQLAINKAEAQSTDPLQHWRGGAGWVCVFGFGWAFVLRPMFEFGATLITGHAINAPVLDIGPLFTLMTGMLGLGGLHVAERIKGVAG